MDDKRWSRFDKLLRGRKSEAEERRETTTAALASLAELRDNSSGDDEHDPEGVPLSSEWARLTAVVDDANARVREIDAALARLDAGEYGICANCGQEIPIERLEALPFASLCVPCATKLSR